MTPTREDIDAVCDLVNDLCGIYLDDKKDYLIEGRLARLVKEHGCANYADLAKKARRVAPLKDEVVNAITTNETLWFRDGSPFEALRHKIIPELIDAKAGSQFPKRFRVWSAACSTGQEAYSIAMAFADVVPQIDNWDLQIYGADISSAAVEKAISGEYNDLEISRGLTQKHVGAYFLRSGAGWRVNDALRRCCRFEVRNLLKPNPTAGRFDIIFCRNVAIYFKPDDRRTLFLNLKESLNQGGWLMTGSGESLADLGPEWTPKQHCRATCYQPNGCNGVATLGS